MKKTLNETIRGNIECGVPVQYIYLKKEIVIIPSFSRRKDDNGNMISEVSAFINNIDLNNLDHITNKTHIKKVHINAYKQNLGLRELIILDRLARAIDVFDKKLVIHITKNTAYRLRMEMKNHKLYHKLDAPMFVIDNGYFINSGDLSYIFYPNLTGDVERCIKEDKK